MKTSYSVTLPLNNKRKESTNVLEASLDLSIYLYAKPRETLKKKKTKLLLMLKLSIY